MTDRTTYSEASAPAPSGVELLTQYSDRFKTLFDASCLPLTSVGGTGDVVTATLDPALDADGLVTGMGVTIEWAATNTGGVTLAINGGTAVPVVDASGDALTAGALVSGLLSVLIYDGASWRVVTAMASTVTGVDRQEFAGSGTWSKPVGLSTDTPVRALIWAGGGAGNSTAGGGGGAFVEWLGRLSDCGATETVTVGQGGTSGGDGGNSSFGSLATAYGGNGADAGTNPRGGGGAFGKGAGGAFPHTDGGDGSGSSGGDGSPAYMGGGGGAGSGNVGGMSKHGGAGGDDGVAGSAPGGGGGAGASGADGMIIIITG